MANILTQVKTALRVKTTAFDDAEIQPLIDACKAELEASGIAVDGGDVLVQQAIVLYCKAFFGSDPDSEKYSRAYMRAKTFLALVGGNDA